MYVNTENACLVIKSCRDDHNLTDMFWPGLIVMDYYAKSGGPGAV